MKIDEKNLNICIKKWQSILSLNEWEIKYKLVNTEWRKVGDIKIEDDEKKAVLMINNYNNYDTSLEKLVLNELLHLKLWKIDQMMEQLIYNIFGADDEDSKFNLAHTQFMNILESTVTDLTEGYLNVAGENEEVCYKNTRINNIL